MGLPRRQRKRAAPAAGGPGAADGPGKFGTHNTQATGGQRSLSEIRSMMSAFQAGTERGRAESTGPGGVEGVPDQGTHHDESSER